MLDHPSCPGMVPGAGIEPATFRFMCPELFGLSLSFVLCSRTSCTLAGASEVCQIFFRREDCCAFHPPPSRPFTSFADDDMPCEFPQFPCSPAEFAGFPGPDAHDFRRHTPFGNPYTVLAFPDPRQAWQRSLLSCLPVPSQYRQALMVSCSWRRCLRRQLTGCTGCPHWLRAASPGRS